MKSFTYTITDEIGIHARPAGLLAKLAKSLDSKTAIEKDGRSADLTRLMSVMSLGVKCGDCVTITAEGGDEDASLAALQKFFTENL